MRLKSAPRRTGRNMLGRCRAWWLLQDKRLARESAVARRKCPRFIDRWRGKDARIRPLIRACMTERQRVRPPRPFRRMRIPYPRIPICNVWQK